jgi:hypothetical protein
LAVSSATAPSPALGPFCASPGPARRPGARVGGMITQPSTDFGHTQLNWFPGTSGIQYQGPEGARYKRKADLLADLYPSSDAGTTAMAHTPTADPNPATKPKVFMVHGHDTMAREQLEFVLPQATARSIRACEGWRWRPDDYRVPGKGDLISSGMCEVWYCASHPGRHRLC